MLSNSNLNSFLKFGYFLDYKNPRYKFDFSRIDKSKYATCTEKELINIGSKLLTEAITSKFECGKRHVVPISGGLDSRAILAGLLECTEAKNIETYTFGTPGTLDLEIGREVGLGLGTKHVSFALTEHRYDIEELLDISNRINHQTVLFHHPPVKRLSSIYGDSFFWMGSFAGPITGGSTEKERVENTLNAKKIFTHKNRYSRSVELSCLKDEDLFDLIEIKNNDMDLSEMADFYNRQVKFIAPHVLLEGFNYKIPFYDIELMSFFLSLDHNHRYNQYLYKKILMNAFPKAFSYRTKSNYGCPLNASNPSVYFSRGVNKFKRIFGRKNVNINYLDFDNGIRERDDLNRISYDSIMDLKNRKIVDWINIDKIWKNHIEKKANHSDALIVLASLEIHLKAKEMNKGKEF